jgi:hypothetical protein
VKYLPTIIVVVVLIIAGVFLWNKYGPRPLPLEPPASGEVPVVVQPNVTHGDPVLPKPDEQTVGVLRIAIPEDTVNHVPARDVYVYINKDPDKPPQVRSDTPVQASYSPVVDPWLVFQARVMVGGGSSLDGYVSPFVGISAIKLFRNINLGIGVDRTAIGAIVSYEFFREFNIGVSYYVLPFRETTTRGGIFVAYRF